MFSKSTLSRARKSGDPPLRPADVAQRHGRFEEFAAEPYPDVPDDIQPPSSDTPDYVFRAPPPVKDVSVIYKISAFRPANDQWNRVSYRATQKPVVCCAKRCYATEQSSIHAPRRVWELYRDCILGIGGLFREKADWLMWTVDQTKGTSSASAGKFHGYIQMSYATEGKEVTEKMCIEWAQKVSAAIAVSQNFDDFDDYTGVEPVKINIVDAAKDLYSKNKSSPHSGYREVMWCAPEETPVPNILVPEGLEYIGHGYVEGKVCVGECGDWCYTPLCDARKAKVCEAYAQRRKAEEIAATYPATVAERPTA
jgi:hypothetical protein